MAWNRPISRRPNNGFPLLAHLLGANEYLRVSRSFFYETSFFYRIILFQLKIILPLRQDVDAIFYLWSK